MSAPSIKAALEAWGAGANLFHQGFAQQTDDPAIVKATMARPGVVLRRPVGTDQVFKEEAEASQAPFEAPGARKQKARKPAIATSKAVHPGRKPVAETPPNPEYEREAARAFEQERERRKRQEKREAAARRKEEARRDRALAAATVALEKAEAHHHAAVAEIEEARVALNARAGREAERWRREREKLEDERRRAGAMPGAMQRREP